MNWLQHNGHIPIIILILAYMHGLRFRFVVEKNGNGRPKIRYRFYFNGKDE